MDKQKQLEAHMAKTMKENNIDQAKTVNGLMQSEYVDCSYEDKTITMKFPVLSWQANRVGGFHGGTVCIMFDIAIAALARFFAGTDFAPTVSLDVKYIRPAAMGDEILVKAKAIATGKRISQFTAEATNAANGKLLATAASVFLNVDTSRRNETQTNEAQTSEEEKKERE